MGKKFSSGSSYHIVLCTGTEGNDIQSSNLFVDNLDGAKEFFEKKVKELVPGIGQDDIDITLDEGYCVCDTGTVLLIEPETVTVGE